MATGWGTAATHDVAQLHLGRHGVEGLLQLVGTDLLAEVQELLLLVLTDLLLGNGSVHKGFNTGGTQRVAFLAQGLCLRTVSLQLCQLRVDGRFVGILRQAQLKG